MTGDAAPEPSLTVVVPSYQRPRELEACLAALALQQLPMQDFEVIVVDDGSATPPRRVIAQFTGRLQVRMLEQANAGPAAARNTGARAARGAHVVFTDDDCRPDPHWLSALTACIARNPDAAIGGRVMNALPHRMCSTASQVLIEFLYRHYNMGDSDAQFLITSNLALPLRTLHELGGFDVSFPLAAGEDRDLCERWRVARHPIVYCPDAIIHHAHDLNIKSFCRQHFNYGRGAHHLHRARARRGQRGFRLESLRFYTDLILTPFGQPRRERALGLSALLLLSQVSYAVGYVFERWHARRHGHGSGAYITWTR